MTYYEDVRVPVEHASGPENSGWRLITSQLNHERIGARRVQRSAQRLFDETVEWARKTEAEDGRRVGDEPWVQLVPRRGLRAARGAEDPQLAHGLELERGVPDPAMASAVKVLQHRVRDRVLPAAARGHRACPARCGPARPATVLRGELETEWRHCQINTFGGGVNEVQRDLDRACSGSGCRARRR